MPRADLSDEASCSETGACGKFFLSGWAPKPYGAAAGPLPGEVRVTDGSVSPAVPTGGNVSDSSSPVSAGGSTFYAEAGPWGSCSAACGGGQRLRDVFCLRVGPGGVQVRSGTSRAGEAFVIAIRWQS